MNIEEEISAQGAGGGFVAAVGAAVVGAVRVGDAAQLRQALLTALSVLDDTAVHNVTRAAILTAAGGDSTQVLDVLTRFGADLQVQDERGDTCLHMAVKNQKPKMARALLDRGVPLHIRNNRLHTALDLASIEGILDLVRVLGIHAQRSSWSERRRRSVMYSALVHAATRSNVDSAAILCDCGADVNCDLDADIGTALHAACESGSSACVDLFLSRGANVEGLGHNIPQTPLMRAAEFGHVDVTRRLLLAGADIDRCTPECSSALSIACHFGHEHVVKLLLEHGASPHLQNQWGFTPISLAVDCPPIVKLLLQHQVELDILCGDRGEAPLHLATVGGHAETVFMLLNTGASVDLLTKPGESAIWLASWKGHMNIVRILLQYNACLNNASHGCHVYAWEYVPLEIALGCRHLDVAKLLLLAGAPLQNPLYFSETDSGACREVPWLRLREEALGAVMYDEEEKGWFLNFLKNTRSLKHLCLLTVRKLLGNDLHKKLPKLCIPRDLYFCLLLKHLQVD